LLAAMSAIGPLSIDMYLPSLPTIAHDLHATAGAAQASVSLFFGGLAVGQLFYGPASDRFGRRAPILVGFALYVAASLACAFAPNIQVLLAARLAQALGGCASMVISRAIVRDHFEHHESARFFSLLALVTGAAPILAPLIGSGLLQVVGWRAIFLVLTVFGTAVALIVLVRLPESRSEAVARQARQEHPFRAYFALVSHRRLAGYLLAGAMNSACTFTYIAASSAVLIGVYGVSPTTFGLLFGVNAVGLVAASQVNRMLLRRLTPDQVLSGAALSSIAFAVLLLVVAASGAGGVWGLMVPLFGTIASASFVQANSLAGALAVDPSRPGSTAALFGASGFGLGALASLVAGALHDGTARPMALVIVICLIGCAAALFGLALRRAAAAA
jgi:DHA1 family bicyclomycin/chloramphenicol resistance-like MFS transporter